MSNFWKTWLTVWCWVLAIFGLVLAGGAFEATSGPVRLLFSLFGGVPDLDLDKSLRFSVGLMGAVTFGWSLTFAAAFRAAHLLGDRAQPVWAMVTVGVMAWYVVDSAISVATGFAPNAASNTLLVIGYLLPVLRSGVLGKTTSGATVPA